MPRLALVFPGQGAQYIGMGRELANQFASARGIFNRADEALGIKLSNICFGGEVVELNRTEITQPAILTTSIAVWEALKSEGIKPQMAAGLSLGEYSALAAAEVIDFETAVRLVAKRGRIMQEAVPEGQGMMAAVLGLEPEAVEKACTEASQEGVVNIANYNCPGQLVISGDKDAVLKAGEILQAAGGRVMPLSVSVPSHSGLMREAAEELRNEIQVIEWRQPAFPVVSNVSAREVTREELAERLIEQLYSPVRWQQSVEYMAGRIDYFIEAGPGKVLSGFVKKIARNQLLGHVEDPATLNQVLNKVRGINLRDYEIGRNSVMSVFAGVKEIIVDILDVPEEEIKLESNLADDLKADSLDVVEMLMQLEDKFGLQIPESTAENLKTVKDVVEYLEKRLQEK